MARSLDTTDVHAIIDQMVDQDTGGALANVDTGDFVSTGETLLASGTENVLNRLSLVLGRTWMAVRPYDAKFKIINAIDTNAFTHRMRKISFYSRDTMASGDWNTQLFTNLEDGFDNGENPSGGTVQSTKSMWVQNQPIPLEMNYGGSVTWEDSTTVYENQLKQAFRNEDEFGMFVSGILTEKSNDIESQKEANNRSILLNHMGNIFNAGATLSKANLTALYNQDNNSTLTTLQLQTTYREDFYKWLVSFIQIKSNMLTHRTDMFHTAPAVTGHKLLRHTPKNKQKLFLYNGFMIQARSIVMPGIFNPEFLSIDNYEGVDYWQSPITPSGIHVTPSITNASGVEVTGNEVNLGYVVGLLYDEDALMTDYQLDRSNVTPLEARKNFRNIWWSFARNGINDITENAILLYMAD